MKNWNRATYKYFRDQGLSAKAALETAKTCFTAAHLGLSACWRNDELAHWSDWQSKSEHQHNCPGARKDAHEETQGRYRGHCQHTYEMCSIVDREGRTLVTVYGFQDMEGFAREYTAIDLCVEAIDIIANEYAANPPVTYAEVR